MKKIFFLGVGLILLGLTLNAQQIRVSGTVTDASDGNTLPGATVLIKGTSMGTITGLDGTYELYADPNAVLVFSFMGMTTQEVEISGRNLINVQLRSDVAMLQEFVVTAVGIERTRRSLGYAVSEVDAEMAIQRAEPDALRALEGKIPGVDISGSSGAAGSATRITIRGNSSFLGSNEPLFVVDGIPYSNTQVTTSNQMLGTGGAYGNTFSTLDPNDIESINVLKGAAAAAIYGSRAANGAVIITTKSGSRDRRPSQKGMEVTYRSSLAWEQIANLPVYQNTYGAGVNFVAQNVNGSWGAPFSEVDSLVTWPGYRAAYPELFGARVPYRAYPNNVRDLFDTGQILENSLNVRSISDRGMYNLTISNTSQDGYIPHSGFDRTSISVGGNQRLDNGMRVGGTASYSRSNQQGGLFGASNYSGSASSFARTLILARNWDMSLPYETPDGNNLMFVGTNQADNPLWSWRYNTIQTKMDRAVATVNLGYDLTDWLQVDYSLGINQYSQSRNEYISPGSRGADGKGRIRDDFFAHQEIESNLILTMYRKMSSDLNIKGVLGHNVNQRTSERFVATGYNVIARGIKNVDNTEEQIVETSSFSEPWQRQRLWGVFADISLEYRNYLFLNLTGRNDFSSTLPQDSRSFFYPALASSLVFTDALGMESNILTEGKVRASWAQVGNDALPYYVGGYFTLGSPWSGNNTMLVPNVSFDPNLTPEFTNEIEIGTELEFFNGRIVMDLAWYDRRTNNQIAPVSLPYTSGVGVYYTNFGEMQNKGVEVGIGLIPVERDNSLRWNIFSTFTRNRSEVLSLTDGVERIEFYTGGSGVTGVLEVGKPYGMLRGSVAARDEDGNFLINPQTGKLIESTELGYLGNPAPLWRSSINNTLSYKWVSLGVVFDVSYGGSIYSNTILSLLGRGVTKDTENRLGTRIIPGYLGNPNNMQPILDENGNKIPNYIQISENGLWFDESFGINTMDEFAVFDATVYRLREMTLTFDLPAQWFQNTFVGSASLTLVGRNIWFFAPNVPKHTNFDPVVNTFGATNLQGIEYDTAPTVARYGINLRVNF
ncbi:MAG: SusC/RagA family TonB-linked outer membrane protein [Bacteroidales bacterium]